MVGFVYSAMVGWHNITGSSTGLVGRVIMIDIVNLAEHGTPSRASLFVSHVHQEQQCGAENVIRTPSCARPCVRSASVPALSVVIIAIESEGTSASSGILALLKVARG